MNTLELSKTKYISNMGEETNLKAEVMSKKEQDINRLIKTSLTGKVHKFDEAMSKEFIHKKMDDLFGW